MDSTPRRLMVHVADVAGQQPDLTEKLRGPPAKVQTCHSLLASCSLSEGKQSILVAGRIRGGREAVKGSVWLLQEEQGVRGRCLCRGRSKGCGVCVGCPEAGGPARRCCESPLPLAAWLQSLLPGNNRSSSCLTESGGEGLAAQSYLTVMWWVSMRCRSCQRSWGRWPGT